jgi:hypothetical protein
MFLLTLPPPAAAAAGRMLPWTPAAAGAGAKDGACAWIAVRVRRSQGTTAGGGPPTAIRAPWASLELARPKAPWAAGSKKEGEKGAW